MHEQVFDSPPMQSKGLAAVHQIVRSDGNLYSTEGSLEDCPVVEDQSFLVEGNVRAASLSFRRAPDLPFDVGQPFHAWGAPGMKFELSTEVISGRT